MVKYLERRLIRLYEYSCGIFLPHLISGSSEQGTSTPCFCRRCILAPDGGRLPTNGRLSMPLNNEITTLWSRGRTQRNLIRHGYTTLWLALNTHTRLLARVCSLGF